MEKELALLDYLNLIKKCYAIYFANQEIYSRLADSEKRMQSFIRQQGNIKEEDDDSSIEKIKQETKTYIENYKNNIKERKNALQKQLAEKKAELEKEKSKPIGFLFHKGRDEIKIYHLEVDIYSLESQLRQCEDKYVNMYIERYENDMKKRIDEIREKKRRNKKNLEDNKRYIEELPLVSLEVKKYKENTQIAKKTLKCVLKKSPLHEKYYPFGYVCQIIEYLDTGRCSELKGPFGCYNLLEHELQMKIIIAQLDKINESLNEIKGNQRIIIAQLDNIRRTTTAIFSELKEIKDEIIHANRTLDDIDVYVGSSSKDLRSIRYNMKLITACASFNASSDTPIAYRITMLNNNLLNKA